MRTAPFSDGTPLVTQWPIPYDHFFDYEMRPDIGDAGTYTYHSHEGFQAMTAHGHLVVQDAADPPYQYAEEEQIIIADWYTKSDEEIESALTSTEFKWPGGPEALVLNGKSGTKSSSDGNDVSCGPSIVTVKPETTYRIRWTSMAALAYTIVEIDDHTDMTIIEADGRYTKPAKIERMQLASGQRFSTLLTTKSIDDIEADGKGGQYWINYRTPDGPNGLLSGKALLKYETGSNNAQSEAKRANHPGRPLSPASHGGPGAGDGAGTTSNRKHGHPTAPAHGQVPGKPEVSVDDSYTTWLEYALEPLDGEAYYPRLEEVTRTIQINLTMDRNTDGLWKFQLVFPSTPDWVSLFGGCILKYSRMNNLSWDETTFKARPGATPYLIDAYMSEKTPDYDAAMDNFGWDPNSLGFPVRIGEVIDIVWQQTNVGSRRNYDYHPMHAHGERYWDLGSGNGEYDPVANEQRFETYTPTQRETTVLYSYNGNQGESTSAWRAWRFKVTKENAGAWIMHCHILHHMVMGKSLFSAWLRSPSHF